MILRATRNRKSWRARFALGILMFLDCAATLMPITGGRLNPGLNLRMVTACIIHCCDLNSTNALCIKKYWNTQSRSALFLFRKELQKKHLQSIKESSCVGSSSNAETDSKLLSFVNSPRRASTTKDASSTKARVTLLDISKDVTIDRYAPHGSSHRLLDISQHF
ncbi:hypothetical protein SASPL_107245 [Salvia splendens]|uniref:Uncharacterized protein n=1 Tax=Salvia splendens TaxID=180675 RepID=A0A8X8YFT3_SALSN|nr:hypothetical protein SASPL_107245 [Salvia splendens]